jgi:hypothetical protein
MAPWCPEPGSNRYARLRAADFKSAASACFAIRAGTAALIIATRKHKGPQSSLQPFDLFGAGNETRTRDLNLGKVALYQLSYSRMEDGFRLRGPVDHQAPVKVIG